MVCTGRGTISEKRNFSRQHPNYIITSLTPKVATEVRNLICNPPTYTELCTELILRIAVSQWHQLQQLLSSKELGDHTPSCLLRQMEQLLGDNTEHADGPLYCKLTIKCVPVNAYMVMASLDKVMEASSSPMFISCVKPSELRLTSYGLYDFSDLKTLLQSHTTLRRASL